MTHIELSLAEHATHIQKAHAIGFAYYRIDEGELTIDEIVFPFWRRWDDLLLSAQFILKRRNRAWRHLRRAGVAFSFTHAACEWSDRIWPKSSKRRVSRRRTPGQLQLVDRAHFSRFSRIRLHARGIFWGASMRAFTSRGGGDTRIIYSLPARDTSSLGRQNFTRLSGSKVLAGGYRAPIIDVGSRAIIARAEYGSSPLRLLA